MKSLKNRLECSLKKAEPYTVIPSIYMGNVVANVRFLTPRILLNYLILISNFMIDEDNFVL